LTYNILELLTEQTVPTTNLLHITK
jgi:hypothetical protein